MEEGARLKSMLCKFRAIDALNVVLKVAVQLFMDEDETWSSVARITSLHKSYFLGFSLLICP